MDIPSPIDEKDLDTENKFKEAKKEGSIEASIEASTVKVEKEKAAEVSAAEKDAAYNKILSKVQTQTQTDTDIKTVQDDAKNVSQKTDADSQIQHLVDLALAKGVIHAVKVARHLEDNYVLDMFHDKLLADELHDALLKKGLIKSE